MACPARRNLGHVCDKPRLTCHTRKTLHQKFMHCIACRLQVLQRAQRHEVDALRELKASASVMQVSASCGEMARFAKTSRATAGPRKATLCMPFLTYACGNSFCHEAEFSASMHFKGASSNMAIENKALPEWPGCRVIRGHRQ